MGVMGASKFKTMKGLNISSGRQWKLLEKLMVHCQRAIHRPVVFKMPHGALGLNRDASMDVELKPRASRPAISNVCVHTYQHKSFILFFFTYLFGLHTSRKYLLSACYGLGTLLDTVGHSSEKKIKRPASMELKFSKA